MSKLFLQKENSSFILLEHTMTSLFFEYSFAKFLYHSIPEASRLEQGSSKRTMGTSLSQARTNFNRASFQKSFFLFVLLL